MKTTFRRTRRLGAFGAFVAVVLTATGAATGGGVSLAAGTSGSGSAAVKADYSLAAQPSSVTVQAGKSASSVITATAVGGFSGSVALATSALPSGVTAAFSSNPVVLGGASQASSTLTFSAVNSASLVNGFAVTVSGTSGTGRQAVTRTTTLSLTVQQRAGSLSVSASPSQLTVQPGQSGTWNVTLTRSGGASTVGLSTTVTGLSGIATTTLSAAEPNVGTTQAVVVQVLAGAAAGNYPVTITQTGGGYSGSASVLLTVSPSNTTGQPFTIAGPAQPVTGLAPGAAAAKLDLRLSNPSSKTMSITSLTVSVNQPAASACGSNNFAVVQLPQTAYPLSLVGGASNVSLSTLTGTLPTLRMINLATNQDSCKSGVTPTVALSFTGTAQGN